MLVNSTKKKSVQMLPERAMQPQPKMPHNKFHEDIIHIYKTHGIISIYAHMYAKPH